MYTYEKHAQKQQNVKPDIIYVIHEIKHIGQKSLIYVKYQHQEIYYQIC